MGNARRRQDVAELDAEERNELPKREFAFPKQRKEPIEDASHVRNAIARFNRVKGVSDDERDEAWKCIKAAANRFKVDLQENDWRELGKKAR